MARSMRGETDVAVWRNALASLRNPWRSSHDMENKVFGILRYSYDRLCDDKHWKCFLYCALYPEDKNIKRWELIRNFIAVGLLDGTNRKESIDEGHAILNVLENASLLECATDKWNRMVKMHDLVRDMAIRIMGSTAMVIERKSLEEILGKKEWIYRDLKWVSLFRHKTDHIEGLMPDCPNISVFLLRDNYFLKTISDSFFVKMISLKVLDLSYTNKMEVLPSSVSGLFNLNALLLCHCSCLRSIPSLAKLTKLRELNLFEYHVMEEFPKGMEKLASLRYLNLDATMIIDCQRNEGVIEKLLNLESFLSNGQIFLQPKELMSCKHLKNLIGVHLGDVSEFNRCVGLGLLNQLETYLVSVGHSFWMSNLQGEYKEGGTELIKVISWKGVSGRKELFLIPHDVTALEFIWCSFGGGSLLGHLPSLGDVTSDLDLRCSAHDCECIIPEWWTKPLQHIRKLVLEELDKFGGLIREEVVCPYISLSGLRVLV